MVRTDALADIHLILALQASFGRATAILLCWLLNRQQFCTTLYRDWLFLDDCLQMRRNLVVELDDVADGLAILAQTKEPAQLVFKELQFTLRTAHDALEHGVVTIQREQQLGACLDLFTCSMLTVKPAGNLFCKFWIYHILGN